MDNVETDLIHLREDLEAILYNKFPWLAVDMSGKDQTRKSNIVPCTVGIGWFDLLNSMFEEINNHYKLNNESIKTLRFYEIKEKFGFLRVDIENCITGVPEIVWKYENLSENICERCGKKGKLRSRNWVVVLCDDCL